MTTCRELEPHVMLGTKIEREWQVVWSKRSRHRTRVVHSLPYTCRRIENAGEHSMGSDVIGHSMFPEEIHWHKNNFRPQGNSTNLALHVSCYEWITGITKRMEVGVYWIKKGSEELFYALGEFQCFMLNFKWQLKQVGFQKCRKKKANSFVKLKGRTFLNQELTPNCCLVKKGNWQLNRYFN